MATGVRGTPPGRSVTPTALRRERATRARYLSAENPCFVTVKAALGSTETYDVMQRTSTSYASVFRVTMT